MKIHSNKNSISISKQAPTRFARLFRTTGSSLLLVIVVIFVSSCGGSSSTPQGTPTASINGGLQGRLIPGSMQPSQTGPYGFTILRQFTLGIASQLKQIGTTWVRFQLNWASLEPQQGQYDWSTLDSAVLMINASGFHLDFPIQNAPDWAKSQQCGTHPLLPGPTEVTQFATALAQRYNGQNGHGHIDSYEIGNEEFDDHLPPVAKMISKYCPGMNLLPIAGPDLKAGYQAIKAQSPQALVGMFAIWWANTQHVQQYMSYLYQNHYGIYFDYANFHYHICGNNPVSGGGNFTSFQNVWQTMHSVMSQNGDGGKPIWLTEAGWPTGSAAHATACVVTPQQQAQYMSDLLQASASSHVIQEFFWYTLNPQDKDSSIYQSTGPLPAYNVIQQYIRQNPRLS
jgi:exo-beta-1,3-glucanase (GH17 family)